MSKRPKLKNGWKYIKEVPPPDGHKVLVTNNPAALNAHGQMSHVWISFVIKDGTRFCGFTDGDRKIHDLVAWHALPRKAV